MKAICVLTFVSILGLHVQAENRNTSDALSLSQSIEFLLKEQEIFFKDADLSGEIVIKFVIDEQHEIIILDIHSENAYLENHATQALQGRIIETGEDETNVVYQIKINFVYII